MHTPISNTSNISTQTSTYTSVENNNASETAKDREDGDLAGRAVSNHPQRGIKTQAQLIQDAWKAAYPNDEYDHSLYYFCRRM